MNTPLLSAHNLVKAYGSTQALAGVSLSIGAGESVAIMGTSGSGKTTLLHALAGIITPDGGTVVFQGPAAPIEVSSLSERERSRLRRESFGFVFQQGLLIPELTAIENVAVPLMLSGYPRREAEARAQHWLVALGLAGMETRRIGELSGGQAQRVAIARAQVTGAPVVFADEPTGALDSRTSVDVLNALLGSTVSQGHTLVVVTHDDSVAARCSRVLRLSDGRLVSDTAGLAAPAPTAAPASTHREVQPMFYGDGWGVASAATLPAGEMPAQRIDVPRNLPREQPRTFAGPAGYPAPARYPAPAGQQAPTGYPAPAGYAAPTGYPAPAGYAAPAGYPAPTGYPATAGQQAPTAQPAPTGYSAPAAQQTPTGRPAPAGYSAPAAQQGQQAQPASARTGNVDPRGGVR